jgi:transposase
MKAKRRRHDPEFKARVALEAVKAVKTVQQLAKEHDLHPVQITEWKKTLLERAARAFGSDADKSEASLFERERTALHAKIGQLCVEVDWLAKKSKQLGL